LKNKDFRKAFTSIELNDEKKEQMLQEIYRKKKQKKRTQMIAIAAGILVLITSLLLLQNFLDGGGQDPLHGEDEHENDEEIVEDEPDRDDDEEFVEEPNDDEEDDEEFERYLTFEVPPDLGGMGDPMWLIEDVSEIQGIYNQGIDLVKLQETGLDSLPVFINPVMPTVDDPQEIDDEFKTITSKKLEMYIEGMGYSIVEEEDHFMILDNGLRLSITEDLLIHISIDDHPEDITEDTLQGKTLRETLELYQEFYYPMVDGLLSYEDVKRNMTPGYSETGMSYWWDIEYMENKENPKDQVFEYLMNRTLFNYRTRGYSEEKLMNPPFIRVPYYHIEPFEVLDEIPLRSIEEIIEDRQEFLGQELKIEHIVKVEVFYRYFNRVPYFAPVYRLYIQMENPEEFRELEHEDQMLIMPLEVLAIPEKYDREQ